MYFIWVDRDGAFYNKQWDKKRKALGIQRYSTYAEFHCSIIERFNRTLKTWMWKRLTAMNSQRWLDILDDLLTFYNHRIHSSTKKRPIDKIKEEYYATVVDVDVNQIKTRKSQFQNRDQC